MQKFWLTRRGEQRAFSLVGRRTSYGSTFQSSRFYSTSTRTRIGIFGDIHFQDNGLKRVEGTGDWIIDMFKREKVNGIVCLGDVLNTRETVSVQSLSSAIRFFEKLATLQVPIHILLGNHDMNLKHDSKISSLDALSMRQMSQYFHLYRDITTVNIAGQECVIFPYLEDQNIAKQWIMDNKDRGLKDLVAFGHLSLPGAIQRYQKDDSNHLFMKRYHDEVEEGNSSRGQKLPSHWTQFKYLVSGHFHHHHFLNEEKTVCYCGSPMQHHFGDSGDDQRGILIFKSDDKGSQLQFIQNPEWDAFRIAKIEKESDLNPVSQYSGKHVAVIYKSVELNPDKVQSKLVNAGALQVKKHSIAVKRVFKTHTEDEKKHTTIRPGQGFDDFVLPYLSLYDFSQNPSFKDLLVETGKQLISTASRQSGLSGGANQMFQANLESIEIENFLGVQGLTEINMKELTDGVWYIEGENGSGKSTLLEAITWCLFNRFLRTDMKASFAVNDKANKNCRVKVNFENGYSIERFRKYADKVAEDNAPVRKGHGVRVYKNGEYLSDLERGAVKDSQTAIEELLGISYDTFSKSVIVGESVFSFLNSDAKQRREMIEELLGLNLFDDFLTESREQKKVTQQRLMQHKLKMTELQSQINSKRQEIQTLQQQQTSQISLNLQQQIPLLKDRQSELLAEEITVQNRINMEIQKLSKKAEYEAQLSSRKKIAEIQQRIVALEKEKAQLSSFNEYEAAKQQQGLMEKQLTSQQQLATDLTNSRSRLSTELHYISDSLNNLEQLASEHICPYCNQDIQECTVTRITTEIQEKKTAKKEVENELVQLTAQIKKTMENINLLQQKIKQANGQVTKLHERAVKTSVIDKEFSRLQSELQREQSSQKGNIDQNIEELGPIDPNAVQKLNRRMSEIHATLRDCVRRLAEAETHLSQATEANLNIQRQLNRYEEEIQAKQNQLKATEQLQEQDELFLSCLSFWEKAFERRTKKMEDLEQVSSGSETQAPSKQFITMRSYMLEQSIDDLNHILFEYTKLLGPNSLPVTFDYEFMIKEEYGKRSAGQRKRNHLVIFFGLFELVRQQSRFMANFLMLDEVFDALDRVGQEHVKEVISLIATQYVDKVFIITHNMRRSTETVIGGYGGSNLIRAEMTSDGTKYHID